MPASTFPRVDLPAPFSPISPWHSPRAISSVTSFKATTPPKVLVISLNWMKVSDILASRFALSSALFLEPLLPVLSVAVHVLLGHHRQRVDHLHLGGSLVVDYLFKKNIDRFGPPAVAILRQQRLNISVLHIDELGRKSIDGDDLDGTGGPFQGIGRE